MSAENGNRLSFSFPLGIFWPFWGYKARLGALLHYPQGLASSLPVLRKFCVLSFAKCFVIKIDRWMGTLADIGRAFGSVQFGWQWTSIEDECMDRRLLLQPCAERDSQVHNREALDIVEWRNWRHEWCSLPIVQHHGQLNSPLQRIVYEYGKHSFSVYGVLQGDQKHLTLGHLFDKPCFLGMLAIKVTIFIIWLMCMFSHHVVDAFSVLLSI